VPANVGRLRNAAGGVIGAITSMSTGNSSAPT
jgi:hypothetical protein